MRISPPSYFPPDVPTQLIPYAAKSPIFAPPPAKEANDPSPKGAANRNYKKAPPKANPPPKATADRNSRESPPEYAAPPFKPAPEARYDYQKMWGKYAGGRKAKEALRIEEGAARTE